MVILSQKMSDLYHFDAITTTNSLQSRMFDEKIYFLFEEITFDN